jgi:hypothetical protein
MLQRRVAGKAGGLGWATNKRVPAQKSHGFKRLNVWAKTSA